ncbi:MAG: hypothetical protein A2Y63_06110, partial [Candidatus Riflebacteria bacterium RBG_13_59_9]
MREEGPIMKEDGRIVAFGNGLLVIRLVLGVVLFARGASILFTWWTGLGMTDYADYLELQGLNFLIGSIYWAWLLGLVQFVGGILIIFGLMTRLSALVNAIVMVLVLVVVEWSAGFFIVTYGITSRGSTDFLGGIEYTLLITGVCVGLFLTGAGRYSLDSGFGANK